MGTICGCSTISPGSFTSHSKQLIKDFFSVLSQRKVLAHNFFFFFSFWLIASDDLNGPCRLMPETACWLDVPEFGSHIRLLEVKLSFLHPLSVSQPTVPLPPPHRTISAHVGESRAGRTLGAS